jgi:hypothetical protein
METFWYDIMPWIVRWVIFPLVLAPKHKAYWRYTAHGVKAAAEAAAAKA